MDRCRDYFNFAVWFAGIGYVVLWPLTANGAGGHPFGASVICGDANDGALAALCQLPHPFTLPFGLHVLGFLAAMLIAVRLIWRQWRRLRSQSGAVSAAALNARLPGAIPARPKKPTRRLRPVKPRTHFGLRGVPH